MTRDFVYTTQFKRDYRRRILTAKTETVLAEVLGRLHAGAPFDPRHRDHPLKGRWAGVRDCHVQPDLLLFYELRGNLVILRRLGSHSDPFG
jgi:mRNA interferase YafQ